MRNRKGFTLTELLVVITIIAILGAIMYPVILRAKEASKMSTCLSNCRQMGISFLLYMAETDDLLPIMDSGFSTTIGDTNGASFCGENKGSSAGVAPNGQKYLETATINACLQSYVKDAAIWWCPNYKTSAMGAGPGVLKCQGAPPNTPKEGDFYWTFYPYNMRLVANVASRWHTAGSYVNPTTWPSWVASAYNVVRPGQTWTSTTGIGGRWKQYTMADYPSPEKTMIFWEKLPLHDLKRVQNGGTVASAYGYAIDPSCRKPVVFMDGHAGVMRTGNVCYNDFDGTSSTWPFAGGTKTFDRGTYFSPNVPRHLNTKYQEVGMNDLIITGWDID